MTPISPTAAMYLHTCKWSSPRLFVVLIIYTYGLYIFLSGLLPVEQTSSSPRTESLLSPKAKRFVLMIVDGLRDELIFSPQSLNEWPRLSSYMGKLTSTYSSSIIQPPTVTMPRIKAITSGRIPKFIDVMRNLDTIATHDDNWISRLISRGWKLEFYGDDTWLKLFPGKFRRYDGTTSFFVNDFEEVDQNVTRHLRSLFKRSAEWDGVILHFLGLDHIGHVEGPHGPTIPKKLNEMDSVVGIILESLSKSKTFENDSWLFMLTGDHGMSDRGGHGGSSKGEVTTALVIVSSTITEKPDPLTYSLSNRQTQQIDLASFIGSVTGAGIPSSSLGVIPVDWLNKFYADPLDRITAVIDLLTHFALLSGCTILQSDSPARIISIVPDCPSEFLSKEQIHRFNNLMKEMALEMGYLQADNITSRSDSSTTLEAHLSVAINFLREIQSKMLIRADKQDNPKMLLGGSLMWLVTLSLCVFIGRQLLGTEKPSYTDCKLNLHAFNSPQHQELLSYKASKLLCSFCAVCLFIQTISLAGSSYAEEEHQFWYFFSVSSLVLCSVLIWLGPLTWSSKRSSLTCVLFISLLDRLLLRQLHRTGDKWVHLPDISDWLYSPNHQFSLWSAQLLAWFILIALRWIAIKHSAWWTMISRTRQLIRFCPLISLLMLATAQLYYRWTMVAASNDLRILAARVVYGLLVVDFILTLKWTQRGRFLRRMALQPIDENRFWSDLLHPVTVYPLLVCLLGRPAVTILWIGILTKECVLAHIIRSFWSENNYEQKRAIKMRLSCCWLLYWIHGWTAFFQQGNSVSLATVDVSAGYVGLRSHQPMTAGFLLMIYTYAGPLFWQMAYLARFSLPFLSEHYLASSLTYFRLGFVFLPVTFSATVCYILQSHLFIWTVFTPKLLYLSVFHAAFLPILVLWATLKA